MEKLALSQGTTELEAGEGETRSFDYKKNLFLSSFFFLHSILPVKNLLTFLLTLQTDIQDTSPPLKNFLHPKLYIPYSSKMSSIRGQTMAVLLDANICIFQERYMTGGFEGGREIARLLLAWLALQFPGVQYFSIYLVGDFSRLTDRMNEALVPVLPSAILDFLEGFSSSVQGKVEFTSGSHLDKATLFAEMLQQHSADPRCRQVLLGALSEGFRSVLGGEG